MQPNLKSRFNGKCSDFRDAHLMKNDRPPAGAGCMETEHFEPNVRSGFASW
ncbi:predicted protein [Brucella suis bv. 3 str. 686]|nr:predicted protein [Brucella suis bv. 4 str. 40]EEY33308.1 predicted protein [Brucella suis bv. 3 str. 686]